MPPGEFVDVAAKVFGAHLVLGDVIAALEQRPEGLDPVGVRNPVDVFLGGVVDDLVVREP